MKPFFYFPSLIETIRSWTGTLTLGLFGLFITSWRSIPIGLRTLKASLLVLLCFYFFQRISPTSRIGEINSFPLSQASSEGVYVYPDAYPFQIQLKEVQNKTLYILTIASGDDRISDENIWRAYRTVRRAGALLRHKEHVLIIANINFLSFDSQPYRILSEVSRTKRRKSPLIGERSIFNSLMKRTLIFSKGISCSLNADIVTCEETAHI